MIADTRKKMEAAIEHFKDEIKNIRTGRANASMLDKVFVEVYGSSMRIRDVASISAPEPRTLLISPYDPQTTGQIAKGIEKANLGFRVIADATGIRIQIPEMDKSVREEMVKILHRKKEEAKVSIRNIRREGNDMARKKKSSGEISEDLLKKLEKDIQEDTDKFCKVVDDLAAAKETEILSI